MPGWPGVGLQNWRAWKVEVMFQTEDNVQTVLWLFIAHV